MKKFAEKLVAVERQVALEKGGFTLFALFLREDEEAGLWDLMVAAPWIAADKAAALHYLVPKIKAAASAREMASLSRVVILDDDHPALQPLLSGFYLEHGLEEIQDDEKLGFSVKQGFVITARRDRL